MGESNKTITERMNDILSAIENYHKESSVPPANPPGTEEELNKCKRICNTCNNNSFKYFLQKCSRCKSVYYCNYVCQRRDWDTSHKQLCPTLKQKYDDAYFDSSIVADISSDSYDISSDSSDMNSDTNLELNVDETDNINTLNSTYQHSLSPYNS